MDYFLHRLCVLCLEEDKINFGNFVHCCIPKKRYKLPIVCEFHNISLKGLTNDVESGEHHVGYCSINRANSKMMQILMKYHKTGEQQVIEFWSKEDEEIL